MKTVKLILVLVVFALNHVQAQKQNQTTFKNNNVTKTFLIEHIISVA
jgi:hypothetical protein